ncbi:hypothetical protein HPG69_001427 [Diceros bicornis minor]|uniref:Uncharacterized protein n=1 Tax=Diceros bicornis minor TaxID=77932 RepID=A0A7J7FFN8_DICBM|nr:hypothetical protein HPG69_001427 [Diceros bicornis minor]
MQELKYDVVLGDAIPPCAFNLPLTISMKNSGGLTLPTSCVPVVISELSDKMTFMEWISSYRKDMGQYIKLLHAIPSNLFN